MAEQKLIPIPIKDINKILTCGVCNGYYRNAHTISECLCTFCKRCLDKSIKKQGSKIECPGCKSSLGLNAYTKIHFDNRIQSIVDKIFPHFQAEEQKIEAAREAFGKRPRIESIATDENKTIIVDDYSNKEQKIDGENKIEALDVSPQTDQITIDEVNYNTDEV
eukprot:gene8036-10891_t